MDVVQQTKGGGNKSLSCNLSVTGNFDLEKV